MIVKTGETRQDVLRSGTIDGINIDIYLQAAAANTALAVNDWNPQNIQVKALLKRDKQTYVLMQDNLFLLGILNTLEKGQYEFYNGIDSVYPAAGVKNVKLHLAKLGFGGPIHINPSDELLVEISVGKTGTFSANVDDSISYVEFEASSCIGYEVGIFQTVNEVVQQNTTKQSFNPGDNVTDMVFINLDKNDLTAQVINNLSLQSDRLDLNLNFNQLMLRHINSYGNVPNYRYGSVLPISATDATGRVFRGLDQFPQTFCILNGTEVDGCRVDISLNGANVAASQNYLSYRKFVTSQEILISAEKRERKHFAENVSKQPKTL